MSYPWIKDSVNGTTPSVTGYLEVTSTNGLYLNGATSQVLLSNTGLSTPVPQTATLTNDHLYIAGGTSITSPTHTEITDISIISNSHDNIFGGDSTTTIQGASMLMLNTQPNLSTSQQLQITPDNVILTTNGGVPTTATWSSILAGGGATPTLSAVLTQGNDATTQLIYNVGQIIMSDGATSLTPANLNFNNNNGSITGLQTINGSAYPPTASVPTLNSVLGAGNNTSGFNIDFNNNSDIQNCVNGGISYLQVSTINGSSYPPYPTSPYGLTNVLAISGDGGGQNITNVNNIDISSINGSAYPPPPYYPDLNSVLNQGNSAYHDIDMTGNQIVNCGNLQVSNINGSAYIQAKRQYIFTPFATGMISNGSSNWGGTPINIVSGTYSITYTIQFDSNMAYGSAGNAPPYMCRGYCFLHSNAFGDYQTTNTNNGFNPSFYISNDASFPNFITMTDMIYIPTTDNWYLGSYFYNTAIGACGMWLFATLTEQ